MKKIANRQQATICVNGLNHEMGTHLKHSWGNTSQHWNTFPQQVAFKSIAVMIGRIYVFKYKGS